MSLRAIPPCPISRPDRIKNGIASSVKLLIPVAILCAVATNAGKSPIAKSARTVEMPMQNAIGTFKTTSIVKLKTRINVGKLTEYPFKFSI
jgi:hypothetical protein